MPGIVLKSPLRVLAFTSLEVKFFIQVVATFFFHSPHEISFLKAESLPTIMAKKRKAAESGTAKIKELAEDDADFLEDTETAQEDYIDDEVTNLKVKKGSKSSKGNASQKHNLGVTRKENDIGNTIVAPGVQPWLTGSTLNSGHELSEVSKYNESTKTFSHNVNVQHGSAFTLKPVSSVHNTEISLANSCF